MGNRIAEIVDIDGSVRQEPDFPIAVVRWAAKDDSSFEGDIVDPIFDHHVTRNLYGRMMTLVEATCETHKLKAVKDLFSKELMAWENDVYQSARQIVGSVNSTNNVDPNNIYTR